MVRILISNLNPFYTIITSKIYVFFLVPSIIPELKSFINVLMERDEVFNLKVCFLQMQIISTAWLAINGKSILF